MNEVFVVVVVDVGTVLFNYRGALLALALTRAMVCSTFVCIVLCPLIHMLAMSPDSPFIRSRIVYTFREMINLWRR